MPSEIDTKAEHGRMSVHLLIQSKTCQTIPKSQPLALFYPFWAVLAGDPLRLASQNQLTAPFHHRSLLPLSVMGLLSKYAPPFGSCSGSLVQGQAVERLQCERRRQSVPHFDCKAYRGVSQYPSECDHSLT